MSTNGYQMGGCVGFLKTLRRLVYEIGPRIVYVTWEAGGSQRRRQLYSEYKMNRRPEKLNRFYEDDIPDTEENRHHQLISLVKMLRHVPVCQIYVSDCEGDDVIAYLSCGPFASEQKIIVSSDKDMYQLLNDRTKVYNLHKKTYVTNEDVANEFRVQSRNFAVAKALCGDPSDNIPGIKGMGFKTAAKRLPFLSLDGDVLLDDVFSYCHSHVDESPVYKRILDGESDVRRNWKLVYLNGGMLSAHQVASVDHVINTFRPCTNKSKLMQLLIKEGINDFDLDGFLYSFNGIDGLEHKIEE
jgi:hypothetical protein